MEKYLLWYGIVGLTDLVRSVEFSSGLFSCCELISIIYTSFLLIFVTEPKDLRSKDVQAEKKL